MYFVDDGLLDIIRDKLRDNINKLLGKGLLRRHRGVAAQLNYFRAKCGKRFCAVESGVGKHPKHCQTISGNSWCLC